MVAMNKPRSQLMEASMVAMNCSPKKSIGDFRRFSPNCIRYVPIFHRISTIKDPVINHGGCCCEKHTMIIWDRLEGVFP